jgi:hypothetical protein
VDYDEDISEADWHADRNAGRWEAIVARQRARIEQLEAELERLRSREAPAEIRCGYCDEVMGCCCGPFDPRTYEETAIVLTRDGDDAAVLERAVEPPLTSEEGGPSMMGPWERAYSRATFASAATHVVLPRDKVAALCDDRTSTQALCDEVLALIAGQPRAAEPNDG